MTPWTPAPELLVPVLLLVVFATMVGWVACRSFLVGPLEEEIADLEDLVEELQERATLLADRRASAPDYALRRYLQDQNGDSARDD